MTALPTLAQDYRELDELRRLAEKAEPGPWFQTERFISTRLGGFGDIAVCQPDHERDLASAAYIAAMHPQQCIALLDRIKELEAGLKPFADEAKEWASCTHPDSFVPLSARYTLGDLRRASALISQPEEMGR